MYSIMFRLSSVSMFCQLESQWEKFIFRFDYVSKVHNLYYIHVHVYTCVSCSGIFLAKSDTMHLHFYWCHTFAISFAYNYYTCICTISHDLIGWLELKYLVQWAKCDSWISVCIPFYHSFDAFLANRKI